jgi:hypothetical protein
MSRGGKDPRGASTKRYWLITALVAWLLLMTPMPFTLLSFGWIAYRVGKYFEKRRKEASKVMSKVGAKYMNIMLRNNKQIINAEVLDEDERFIRIMDSSGKELLINKNDISILEPITMD